MRRLPEPLVHTVPAFTFEDGAAFAGAPVAYRTWGRLNAAADNAVLVLHALTGDTHADVWWGGLVGPGRAIDTDRFFVVCPNVIGSPYGTLSPLTVNPATARSWGAAFPVPTIRDTVRLHRHVLDALGVRSVALATGGSMGGMQALEWAFEVGEDGAPYVRAVAPLAACGRHSAWCIGWSEAQRMAIRADARWNGGDYTEQPEAGLAAARAMAMVSYRTAEAFSIKHGRAAQAGSDAFAVESYLRYQGAKLVARFDANCYLRITEMMDTHDLARGRGDYEAVVASITQPLLAVGIDSDVLYLAAEARELAALAPRGTYRELASPWGHDAFLIEFDALGAILRDWMAEVEI